MKRLMLLTGDEISYFAYRIAQLVGCSTSHNGRGLVPIFPQSSHALQTLQRGCLTINVTMKGQTQIPPQQSQQLRALEIPLVEIQLESPQEFAAGIFKWEIATAMACTSLGVNCFHGAGGEPNLAEVAEQLENISAKRERFLPAARVEEHGIALYPQGETGRSISSLNLRSALQNLSGIAGRRRLSGSVSIFRGAGRLLQRDARAAGSYASCAGSACAGCFGPALSVLSR